MHLKNGVGKAAALFFKVWNFGHYHLIFDHPNFYFASKAQKFKNLFFFKVFFEGALLKSSDLISFEHISWQNECFTIHIWYVDFVFRKFIRFPDFFPDFPDFHQIFRFLQRMDNLLLSYDMILLFLKSYPVSGFSPDFSRIFFKSSDFDGLTIFLQIIDILFIKYDVMVFFPGNLSGFRIFSQIFFKSSDFDGFNHISFSFFSESLENFCILLILTRMKWWFIRILPGFLCF